MSRRKLTIGSLFAGIGGFDLGFERAGLETKWQVEIDPFCNKILARHFPKAKRYGDITKINPAELEQVDVITGGFPCQDLSVAGKRKGLSGERSGLFFEATRIIAGTSPAWVVLENVPGLRSSNFGRDLARIFFEMEKLGYSGRQRTLDARYFGVAQRRRRMFFVFRLGGKCPLEILFESEGVRRDSAKGGKAGGDIADTIGASFARHRGCSAGNDSKLRNAIIVNTLSGGGRRGYRIGTEDARGGQLVVSTITAQPPSRRNGGSRPTAGEFIVASESGQGFWKENRIAPIRAEGENRPSRPSTVVCTPSDPNGGGAALRLSRRLDGTPDSPRYRALGNAVTVNVAEWIARRIAAFEANP